MSSTEARSAYPAFIDDDVEPAKAVERGLDGRSRVGGHCNVVGDRAQPIAVFRDQLVKSVRAASGREYPIAPLECRLYNFATETAGSFL